MKRSEAIEATARAHNVAISDFVEVLAETEGRSDQAPGVRALAARVKRLGEAAAVAREALDAALAMPPDPVPSPTERDRALVRAALPYVDDPRDTEPDEVVDAIIADVNAVHPPQPDDALLRACVVAARENGAAWTRGYEILEQPEALIARVRSEAAK